MYWEGIIIGAGSFIIIGVLHPVVIQTEYHWGVRAWPLFLVIGLLCAAASLFMTNILFSSLASVLGFSFLWSIKELFDQEKRVQKGWFPQNPRRMQNKK